MGKRLIKVLLPITALLLSSCEVVDWVKNFINGEPTSSETQTDEETKTGE